VYLDANDTHQQAKMESVTMDIEAELQQLLTSTAFVHNAVVLIVAVTDEPEKFAGSRCEELLMRLTRQIIGKSYTWHVAAVKREDTSSAYRVAAMNVSCVWCAVCARCVLNLP
jgi:hypothetical protein